MNANEAAEVMDIFSKITETNSLLSEDSQSQNTFGSVKSDSGAVSVPDKPFSQFKIPPDEESILGGDTETKPIEELEITVPKCVATRADSNNVPVTSTKTSPRNLKRVSSEASVLRLVKSTDAGSSPEKLMEYKWPPDEEGKVKSSWFVLQEQLSEYLGVLSFKRKYPDIERRQVEVEERTFLMRNGWVTEFQADLGLTALRADEVHGLMAKDYPEKYQPYKKVLQERRKQRQIDKQREKAMEKTLLMTNKDKMAAFRLKAMKSAAEFNKSFLQERKEERAAYFDLQTNMLHYPQTHTKQRKLSKEQTKVNLYPVAVIAGQYQNFTRSFTSDELNHFPVKSVLCSPTQHEEGCGETDDSDNSESDDSLSSEDDSSTSGSLTSSSSGVSDSSTSLELAVECRPAKSVVGPVVEGYRPKNKPDAVCGICKKNEIREEPIHCSECDNSGHPRCLELTESMLNVIARYPWQCMECKTCVHCKDPHDEDKMMFCDNCDRGFHTFCIGLRNIPLGHWVCETCGVCGSCGRTTPGDEKNSQWQHQYSRTNDDRLPFFLQTLCMTCYGLWVNGCFCPLCLECYDDALPDFKPMVCCEQCDRWIHPHCDNIDKKKFKQITDQTTSYKCAICRGEMEEKNNQFHRENKIQRYVNKSIKTSRLVKTAIRKV